MIKWLAFIMAWLALVFGASTDDLRRVTARLNAIEERTCILMAVNTPSGVASICADAAPRPSHEGGK